MMEDITGKQLGQYQVLQKLGEGGMATVYKAYHPEIERYVALKILPRRYAKDPEFIGRFEQEAKVVAQLQHPHIMPVFDYGQSDGYTYIVMPYIETGTLTDLLGGKPLPIKRILRVLTQVGDALDYAHSCGVIHRDVKPSNILIDERGNCLLMDFGIAKIIESTQHFTLTGNVLGTPAYISPEQGLGDTPDGRSDIYSLGVVMYQMLTGRLPYDAETPMAVAIKHIYDPLPPPRSINPNIPENLERVLLKALSKDREDRYATAGAFVAALQAVGQTKALADERVPPEEVSDEVSKPAPSSSGVSSVHAERTALKRRSKWIRSGLVVGGLAISIVVFVGIVIGLVLWMKGPRDQSVVQGPIPSEAVEETPGYEMEAILPTPRPNGSLLGEDTFDDDVPSARPLFKREWMTFENKNGKGRLASDYIGSVMPVTYPKIITADFYVEFEFWVNQTMRHSSFGFLFRSDIADDGILDWYYALQVRLSDETLELNCWVKPDWQTTKYVILPPNLLYTDRANHMRLEVVEDQYRIFINDIFVTEFIDDTILQPGIAGFFILPGEGDEELENDQVDFVEFDNLRIYAPMR